MLSFGFVSGLGRMEGNFVIFYDLKISFTATGKDPAALRDKSLTMQPFVTVSDGLKLTRRCSTISITQKIARFCAQILKNVNSNLFEKSPNSLAKRATACQKYDNKYDCR